MPCLPLSPPWMGLQGSTELSVLNRGGSWDIREGEGKENKEQESEGERRKKKHLLVLLLFSFIFKLFPDQTRRGITEKKGIRIREEPCENVYPSNMCKLPWGRAHDPFQPKMQPGTAKWGVEAVRSEFLRVPLLFIYSWRQLSLHTHFFLSSQYRLL